MIAAVPFNTRTSTSSLSATTRTLANMEISDAPWEANDSMLPIFNKPRFVRKLNAPNSFSEFERLWDRLEYLEEWRKTYPENVPVNICDDDKDLIRQSSSKSRLQRRCNHVRYLVNQHLPKPPETSFPLEVKKSQVDGLGLFTSQPIPKGATVTYYWGHLHSSTSILLQGNKEYVFELSKIDGEQLLVDACSLISMQARYMNDALCEEGNNCSLVPQPDHFRFAVMALRDIDAGEELFASYGTQYWRKRTAGAVFRGL